MLSTSKLRVGVLFQQLLSAKIKLEGVFLILLMVSVYIQTHTLPGVELDLNEDLLVLRRQELTDATRAILEGDLFIVAIVTGNAH